MNEIDLRPYIIEGEKIKVLTNKVNTSDDNCAQLNKVYKVINRTFEWYPGGGLILVGFELLDEEIGTTNYTNICEIEYIKI